MNETVIKTKTGRFVIRSMKRRRSIRAAIGSSVLHTIAATCMMTAAMQLYCLELGANDLFLGLVTGSIWAGAPFLLLGISLMKKFGKRRILVFWSGWLPAVCMAFVALLPLFHKTGILSAQWILYWLLAALLLRSISDNIGAAGWFPVLHDNVPSRIIGKFFGTFRVYWQISVLASTLLIAWFLGQSPAWWKFCIIFAVGEICFVLKIFCLKQLEEKPIQNQSEKPISSWRILKRAIKNPEIGYFLRYIMLYNLAVYMCLPFQIKYLKHLGYSEGYIMAANAMISLGATISLPFWGRLADRFGNRSVFNFSHIGIIVVLAGWIIVDKNLFSAIYVFALYGLWSVFQSANGIAQTRYMFHSVSERDQSNIVIINACLTLSIALAPLISGLFLWLCSELQFTSGALSLNQYHLLFVSSALLVIIPHRMHKRFQSDLETPATDVFVIVTRPLLTLFGSFVSFPRNRGNSE